MFYRAASLAFAAGGIILLYLLWRAQPVEGQTLNAVVFGKIIESFGMSAGFSHTALLLVLVFEAGRPFLAPHTRFLRGPHMPSNTVAPPPLPPPLPPLSSR